MRVFTRELGLAALPVSRGGETGAEKEIFHRKGVGANAGIECFVAHNGGT